MSATTYSAMRSLSYIGRWTRPALEGHADAVRRIRFGGSSGQNLVSADDLGQAIVWTSLNERHRFVTRMSVPEQVGSRLRLMKADNGDVFLVGSDGIAQWGDGAFQVVLEAPVPRSTTIGGRDSTVVVGWNGDSLATWDLNSADRADELPRVRDTVAIGSVRGSDRSSCSTHRANSVSRLSAMPLPTVISCGHSP